MLRGISRTRLVFLYFSHCNRYENLRQALYWLYVFAPPLIAQKYGELNIRNVNIFGVFLGTGMGWGGGGVFGAV